MNDPVSPVLSWTEKVFSDVGNERGHIIKIFYSGFYFTFSFILVSYIGDAISAFSAWSAGFHPTFSYDGLESLRNTTGWVFWKVQRVCLASPILGIVISTVSLITFHVTDPIKTHTRTFLLWVSINGFLLYYSYIFTGILCADINSSKFFTGFVALYTWLHWEQDGIPLILGAQALISSVYAILFIGPIKQLNYSNSLTSKKFGNTVIPINIVLLPFLVGVSILVLVTVPLNWEYQSVRIASFIPIYLIQQLGVMYSSPSDHMIVRGGMESRSIGFLLFCLLALLLFVRTILSYEITL